MVAVGAAGSVTPVAIPPAVPISAAVAIPPAVAMRVAAGTADADRGPHVRGDPICEVWGAVLTAREQLGLEVGVAKPFAVFADGHGAWAPHSGRQGSIQHFNGSYWQGGHWWHGTYGARPGWWWVVGPDWYWFPTAIYPYPDPYTPPGMASGYWYWCDAYQQYYPYVGACPSGWRTMQPQ